MEHLDLYLQPSAIYAFAPVLNARSVDMGVQAPRFPCPFEY